MTLDQIYDKLKTENAASILSHGFWKDLPVQEQAAAIQSEYGEWYLAYIDGDIDGPHGEVAELIDLANCCFRRIMYLTGEKNA